MDLHHQEEIKRLVEKHGAQSLLILLGAPDPESAALSAETVTLGDPTFAGPLTEVQLGLDVYHILEDEVRQSVPEEVWEEQIGVMGDVLDAAGISQVMQDMREKAATGS